MQEDFQKEELITDKTEEEKKIELIMSVLKTKRELDLANKNFETAEKRTSRLLCLSNKSK